MVQNNLIVGLCGRQSYRSLHQRCQPLKLGMREILFEYDRGLKARRFNSYSFRLREGHCRGKHLVHLFSQVPQGLPELIN
jgi:hypothetical protein